MTTPENSSDSRDNRHPRRRRFSLKVAVAALVLAVAGAGYSYHVGKQAEDLQRKVQVQTERIDKISVDLAGRNGKHESSSHGYHLHYPPGICVCVSKPPVNEPRRSCMAKTEVCDRESREVCEGKNPGFYCG